MRPWLLVALVSGLTACSFRQQLGEIEDAGGREGSAQNTGLDAVVQDARNTGLDAVVQDAQPDRAVPNLTDAGTLPHRACPPPADAGPELPVIAIWEGYLEQSAAWPTSSDALRIVLRSSESGEVTGSVVFGVTSPPPPPTDSDECYPVDYGRTDGHDVTVVGVGSKPIEGVEYPIMESIVSEVRLKFRTLAWTPWADWCACQVPPPGSSTCLPALPGFGGPETGCFLHSETGDFHIPCCKLSLCMEDCHCTDSGCAIGPNGKSWYFDLTVNGDQADGTAPAPPGASVNFAHLIRTQ